MKAPKIHADIKVILVFTSFLFSGAIFLFINFWYGLLGISITYGLHKFIQTKPLSEDVKDTTFKDPKPRPTLQELINKYRSKLELDEIDLRRHMYEPTEVTRNTTRIALLRCFISDLESLLVVVDNTVTLKTQEYIKIAEEKMSDRSLGIKMKK